MPLARILEPEVMDTPIAASDYDAMDHSGVNSLFVADLLAALTHFSLSGSAKEGNSLLSIADLGAGTARIPILLCQAFPDCRVMAVDAAVAMLELAHYHVEIAGLSQRIQLEQADAKDLPCESGAFGAVISNSIIHHIPEPLTTLREAVRITAPGGLLFFRDLLRPDDKPALESLVQQYAGNENDYQRRMFAESLLAALTLSEVQDLIESLGFPRASVAQTSDRHWTWSALKS